jgi:hypothetical protein
MDVLLFPILVEHAVNDEKILSVSNVLRGNGVEISPCMSQVVDGIEHIGLAYPVISNKTIDLLVEVKADLFEILKID